MINDLINEWILSGRVHGPKEADDALLGALEANAKVRDPEASEKGYFSSISGAPCYFFAPEESTYSIDDIATALSREHRFANQTRRDLNPYSVAQHSVLVSRLCRPENALVGLLHDATEAFIKDLPTQLKRYLNRNSCGAYRQLEEAWAEDIGRRFGVDLASLPKDVKAADLIALELERHDILEHGSMWASWGSVERPTLLPRIRPETAMHAKSAFLARFKELTSK